MNLVVTPEASLFGEASLPGDKSLSHRASLLAAMAEGESRISNFLVSGVTKAMLNALTALDVSWQLDGTQLTVRSNGMHAWNAPAEPINCGNSATTLRLLAGGLAAAGVPAVLDGTPGLRRRPMKRIIEPLQQMGMSIETVDGRAPLKLKRRQAALDPLDYALPVASAQVKSCLLLAALAAGGPTTLREPGPSRDHTERMLASLGIDITTERAGGKGEAILQYVTHLNPPDELRLPPLTLALPGDFSAAAFLIVAALITPGSQVKLKNVGLNPTRTGLLDALLAMGADIQTAALSEHYGEPVGDLVVRHSHLHGTQVFGELVVRMIDEFPCFAVAAAYAKGRTTVCQAEELRYKESDRITSMCSELRSLGASVDENQDGFTIQGGNRLDGGRANSHGDHRLAMALAIAGLASQQPIIVHGAELINESFPAFEETLTRLGGQLVTSE